MRLNSGMAAMLIRVWTLSLVLLVAVPIMTLTHEVGHLLGGWLSGATLVSYDLTPWHWPYSIFAPDPHPLVTLWAGPIFGCLFPLAVAVIVRHPYAWLIAYGCAWANGAYLMAGWFTGDLYLDTTQLRRHGASFPSIALFISVTIAVGYGGFRQIFRQLLQEISKERPAKKL